MKSVVILKLFLFYNSRKLIIVTEVRASHHLIPKSNIMSKIFLLATITSVVQGDHIYNPVVTIGELL